MKTWCGERWPFIWPFTGADKLSEPRFFFLFYFDLQRFKCSTDRSYPCVLRQRHPKSAGPGFSCQIRPCNCLFTQNKCLQSGFSLSSKDHTTITINKMMITKATYFTSGSVTFIAPPTMININGKMLYFNSNSHTLNWSFVFFFFFAGNQEWNVANTHISLPINGVRCWLGHVKLD